MRLKQYIIEKNPFKGWVNYTPQSLEEDFSEYKKKESTKWKRRAKSMGFRFPIFKDFPEFTQALKNAQVKKLFKGEAEKITNVALNDTIEDVKRIDKGFELKSKMPMPIILKGSKGMHILAGNTRLNIAYIMNQIPEVLIVDVTK